jgi:hypothetical protein
LAPKKQKVDKFEVEEIKLTETVLVFRVCRAVTDKEFEQIKNRLESQSVEGVKIVLAPFSVELEG